MWKNYVPISILSVKNNLYKCCGINFPSGINFIYFIYFIICLILKISIFLWDSDVGTSRLNFDNAYCNNESNIHCKLSQRTAISLMLSQRYSWENENSSQNVAKIIRLPMRVISWRTEGEGRRGIIVDIEYQSVCTFVGIGPHHSPPPQASVSPPLDPKKGGT